MPHQRKPLTLLLFLALLLPLSAPLLAQEVRVLIPRSNRALEDIAWHSDGRIYTPDYVSGVLYRIDLNGFLDTVRTGLQGPLGGTFDPAGNYYYSEFGAGSLHRLSPSGRDSVLATDLGQPSGTYYDAAGNRILVSDYTFSRLFAVDLAGGTTSVLIDSSSVTGLNGPDGIVPALDGNGYLIANYNDNVITRLDSLGDVSTFTRLQNERDTTPNSGYLVPFRDEGYLVNGFFDHRIWYVSATGAARVWAGTGVQSIVDGARLDTVGFTLPNGMAISPTGDTLLLAENGTVAQVRIITGLNDFATAVTRPPGSRLSGFQLFPQPVTSAFTTTFSLPAPMWIQASIISAGGRLLHTYAGRHLGAGAQAQQWSVPPAIAAGGVYYLQLRSRRGLELTVPMVFAPR